MYCVYCEHTNACIVHVSICTRVYLCVYECTYVCACMCVCACMYILRWGLIQSSWPLSLFYLFCCDKYTLTRSNLGEEKLLLPHKSGHTHCCGDGRLSSWSHHSLRQKPGQVNAPMLPAPWRAFFTVTLSYMVSSRPAWSRPHLKK